MTISRAQVYRSLRSCDLFKLTADQVLVFDWIAGSCQVKLLKTGQQEISNALPRAKAIDQIPAICPPPAGLTLIGALKVNQITTGSPIKFFCSFCLVHRFCDY